ncbi:MAG: cytochrome o ubiquinol oxidase subunit IV [Arsenophonus sp. ET-YP4-MAG3]
MSYIKRLHSTINEVKHSNKKTYFIGFILSIILTVIPFLIVMNNIVSHYITLWIIISAAIIQIFVHLICFLHMKTSLDGNWNLIAFLFTILIISIIVIGSLWIMYHVNINMMLD